mgnify:CR=1 FL=1
MFYIEILKKLYSHICDNTEIPEEEKAKAKKLVKELTNLLAIY